MNFLIPEKLLQIILISLFIFLVHGDPRWIVGAFKLLFYSCYHLCVICLRNFIVTDFPNSSDSSCMWVCLPNPMFTFMPEDIKNCSGMNLAHKSLVSPSCRKSFLIPARDNSQTGGVPHFLPIIWVFQVHYPLLKNTLQHVWYIYIYISRTSRS